MQAPGSRGGDSQGRGGQPYVLVAAIYGALADQVPEHQLGFASAVPALANPLATLGGTYLVDALSPSSTAFLLVPGIVGALLIVPFLLYGRDRRIDPSQVPAMRALDMVRFLWSNMVRFLWSNPVARPGGAATPPRTAKDIPSCRTTPAPLTSIPTCRSRTASPTCSAG